MKHVLFIQTLKDEIIYKNVLQITQNLASNSQLFKMEAKAQYEIRQDTSIINSLKRLLYNDPRTEKDFDVYLVIKNNFDTHIHKHQINTILCKLDCNDLGVTSDGDLVFKTF